MEAGETAAAVVCAEEEGVMVAGDKEEGVRAAGEKEEEVKAAREMAAAAAGEKEEVVKAVGEKEEEVKAVGEKEEEVKAVGEVAAAAVGDEEEEVKAAGEEVVNVAGVEEEGMRQRIQPSYWQRSRSGPTVGCMRMRHTCTRHNLECPQMPNCTTRTPAVSSFTWLRLAFAEAAVAFPHWSGLQVSGQAAAAARHTNVRGRQGKQWECRAAPPKFACLGCALTQAEQHDAACEAVL